MIKKITLSFVAILVFGGVLASQAYAGKIVLAHDEWTLSNSAFSATSNTETFATNVADWFTDSSTGNFLAYSSNFGLTGSALASTMTSAGHTWTNSTTVPTDLATLSTYDAIFLAGNAFDNQALIDYVNGGGNVYLAGGTGWGGAANEAARWNTFLNTFGLGFGSFYNGVCCNLPINSTHEIFDNVSSLYQNNGNDALDIDVNNALSQVLVSLNGHDAYAVYDSSLAVPAPAAIFMFVVSGLFVSLRRRFFAS